MEGPFKILPQGVTLWAIANEGGFLVQDGGEFDGTVLSFSEEKEAKKFIAINEIGATHFIVKIEMPK